MKHIIIGTAGHVDHGKTLLIKALSGIDTDRLQEEKKRGITIELGFAHLDFPDGTRAGIVDVPGHERFIKNMLAGAGGISLALLVIAADEGIMPQTVEHLGILSLLGVTDGVVAVTKIDKVDDAWLTMILDDIAQNIKGTFLEGKPVVQVSAYTGAGIEDLKDVLLQRVRAVETNMQDIAYRLPVDRVFSIDGFGTVVTGTLIEGQLAVGEEIVVYPRGLKARVRGLQVHNEDVPQAYAGQRVAANLAGIHKTDLQRGDVLAFPGSLTTFSSMDTFLRVLPDSPWEIRSRDRFHLYHGTNNMLCRCVLLGKDKLEPGEEGFAQLLLEEPLSAKTGDRFILRFLSPVETIGGGVILDVNVPRHKKPYDQLLSRLATLQKGNPDDLVYNGVLRAFAGFAHWQDYVGTLPLPRNSAESSRNALVAKGTVSSYAPEHYAAEEQLAALAARADGILKKHHKEHPLQSGMRRDELRQKLLGQAPPALGDGLLNLLAERGEILAREQLFCATNFSVSFTQEQCEIQERLAQVYAEGGYTPPELSEVFDGFGRKKEAASHVLAAMLADGELILLTPQIIFSSCHYNEALHTLRQEFPSRQPFTLGQLRDLLGTSRKYALALAEYLDKNKITRREKDFRIMI